MEKLMTSIISLFLALSILNAKANDVPRQNENIIANYSLDEDDTLRYSNHYLFERAYNVIGDMLTDKRPVDFKKAVFAVENAFYDGKLDSASYYGEIARIGKGIKALAASPAVNAPTRDMALNYSIYLFYTQPMALNKGKPYYYDEQSLHDSLNLEYGLISRLLTTGKGTCHSMPFLYRILADEVGAKAYIVSVPLHYFIRTQNEKGNWFNFESTTGTFSRNEYYIESYHVNDSALQSGLYMSNLTDKGNLVQCLYDLLNIYEKKTGFFSNSFVRRCYTLGLKYRPNDNLRLWELEDIHYQLKKKAWHKGHKNNNDVMADDELRPERLRLREKELELLRIGYHRFTAAEYAERYHAALDYCRDRQSKVARFNTIDPKADQYPGINPYLYCAGNPIMYVDPNGMKVYKSVEQLVNVAMKAMQKFQPDEDTYCNFGVQYINNDTKHFVGKANQMGQLLKNSKFATELSAEEAQFYANQGVTIFASWINPSGASGHIAVVAPGEMSYSPTLKKKVVNIFNIGRKNERMKLTDGFGYDIEKDVKFYILKSDLEELRSYTYDCGELPGIEIEVKATNTMKPKTSMVTVPPLELPTQKLQLLE